MPYETDNRLRSYLGTDSSKKEQMCLALLKNDRRFTNVTPRQPYGGPDDGRDIEALFKDRDKTFGAVGFVNNANDSPSQKKSIKKRSSNPEGVNRLMTSRHLCAIRLHERKTAMP